MESNQHPNQDQRFNLAQLLRYLESLPDDYDQFGMREFSSGKLPPAEIAKAGCGTVLCLAGHAPLCGIGNLEDVRQMGWPLYVETYLCPRGEVFRWLFHAQWSERDNTLVGAIRRLRYYLNIGLPEDVEHILYADGKLPWEIN